MTQRIFLAILLTVASGLAASEMPGLRPNTEIPVELRTKLIADTAATGDSIVFRPTGGVLIGHNVVIPRGAEILATVDAVRRDRNDSRLTLVIRFHQVSWEENSVPLNAVVASVESVNQKQSLIIRHIHNLFSQKTMLEGVDVYAHVRRNAFTEFASTTPNFELRPGIRLVLRQIDPDKEPEMMVKDLVLDVNRGWRD